MDQLLRTRPILKKGVDDGVRILLDIVVGTLPADTALLEVPDLLGVLEGVWVVAGVEDDRPLL